MRILILKQPNGLIEGVDLEALKPGVTYEVPLSIGAVLLAQGDAEEDFSTTPALVVQRGDRPFRG